MKTFSMTDIGKMRQINQDSVFTSEEPLGALPNLFIVADGMGGHNAGDYASKYTVDRFSELCAESKETDIRAIFDEAATKVNSELIDIADHDVNKSGMGTTLVAATIKDGKLHIVNIGDSRLYVIGSDITQLTRDHSYVQDLVRKGELDEAGARIHPKKNVITRAIGAAHEVEIDYFEYEIEEGDRILLCSDGLTNMIEDRNIRSIVKSRKDLADAVAALVDEANECGGADNISVIMIEP
ncbi:MAG: Stp1/IreP family PP2C-type Ser/Thr phosphatase [Eubacterium sp.]|nr:Stp1/IreP family PP2C-type Ser/Thr phosphatase [Eubacterium sp.]